MSNYVKITDYAAKDALLSGDSVKRVKGSEIGADFDAVAVAIATKSDTSFLQVGTGAVATTVHTKLRETVSVKDFGAVGDGVTNDTAAIALGVAAAIAAHKALYFPGGTYLLTGTAGSDTYVNGVLIPFNSINTDPTAGLEIFGEAGATVLKANANNMCVLRIARNYTTVRDIIIDGNNKTTTIGIGIIPESITQTTTQVSQSFAVIERCAIQNCVEGMLFQPGPTITGNDSGCFYHSVSNCYFTTNTRHVWMKKDATAAGNRTTRTQFNSCQFLYGNTGVMIDGGTEIDFISCNFELISTGVTPSASPTAFNYADTNPANIRLIGGYAEACTISITSVSPEHVFLFGFYHSTAVSASEYQMSRYAINAINVGKVLNTPTTIFSGGTSYAGIVIDPDGVDQKTFSINTNNTERARWFNGLFEHKGSLGDIELSANGTGIAFKYAGNNSITLPSSGVLITICDSLYWRNVAGTDVVRMAASGTLSLFPAADNATLLGQNGFRWKEVWAANGTIQTSDPKTKKDIEDSALGLDFINALRPVSYRWIVGENKIVGVREVKPAVMRFDEELGEDVVEIPAETENIIEPVPGKRRHYGFLTTNVKEALNGRDFGGYIKVDPSNPNSEEALRYDQFLSPIVKAIQELSKENDDLKTRLAAIEKLMP